MAGFLGVGALTAFASTYLSDHAGLTRDQRTGNVIRMKRTTVSLLALGLLVSSATLATVVYRWVDEGGRTHMSDVVPEKYRRSARPVELGPYEVSPDARKQAEERAARDKAAATTNLPVHGAKAPQAASVASTIPSRRPSQAVTSTTDCATWRRLYQESMDCFGPYRTTRGGIKPEAFDNCNVIPSPDEKCGPLRN